MRGNCSKRLNYSHGLFRGIGASQYVVPAKIMILPTWVFSYWTEFNSLFLLSTESIMCQVFITADITDVKCTILAWNEIPV